MKKLIFIITIITATSLVRAGENDEIIWETEQISELDQIVLSPDGDIFYNTNDSIIQVRLVEDGTLVEEINIEDFSLNIEAMSISNDGNLLALSGDNPYVYIYDLSERRLVSKITAKVFVREEYGENVVYEAEKWLASDISPDGTRITGILYTDRGEGISNFVVIDISSNEVLFEEPRLLYDIFNPSDYSPKWLSSTYSSDGSNIVAQLEYTTPDPSSPDSIYILNANTFKKDTVLANTYFPEFLKGFVSYYNPMLAYQSKDSINLYNMSTRKIIKTNLNTSIWSFLFLRIKDFLIYGYNWESDLYNLTNNESMYKYKTLVDYICQTKDSSRIISIDRDKIVCLRTIFNITNINESESTDVYVSPNPTTGEIRIKLNNQFSSYFNYELISISGQIVKCSSIGFIGVKNKELTINNSDVANGQYILRIYSEKEEFIFTLIKNG